MLSVLGSRCLSLLGDDKVQEEWGGRGLGKWALVSVGGNSTDFGKHPCFRSSILYTLRSGNTWVSGGLSLLQPRTEKCPQRRRGPFPWALLPHTGSVKQIWE